MHATTDPARVCSPRYPGETIHRLRRAGRWVREARRSYEDGYACIDVVDQVLDLRQELDQVVRLIVEDHAGGCRDPVIHSSVKQAGACRLLPAISRTGCADGASTTAHGA